jgi:predicted GNAT superfamily acetyltransferase
VDEFCIWMQHQVILNTSHQISIQGVEFKDLSEYLQEAFKDYVDEECGVNEDVQTFIMMFAHHRDHEEYVKWMQTVKSVLT